MPSVIPSSLLLVPFLIPLNSFESLSVAEAFVPQPVSRFPLALASPSPTSKQPLSLAEPVLAPPPEPSPPPEPVRRAPGDPSRLHSARCRLLNPSACACACACLPARRTPPSHIPQPFRVTCSHHCHRHTVRPGIPLRFVRHSLQ